MITASGPTALSHTESCVALHRERVSSGHRRQGKHLERFPGEYVAIEHIATSAPPLHSRPGLQGSHRAPALAVPGGHRMHEEPLSSM